MITQLSSPQLAPVDYTVQQTDNSQHMLKMSSCISTLGSCLLLLLLVVVVVVVVVVIHCCVCTECLHALH